ncbi:hypothetical protein MMC16_003842 [Acarospora aff. strigata]|nr:hypothetical protein [Acarospora aff. strigata]
MAWKKGIEVRIVVNGNVAQGFNSDDDGSEDLRIVTRYIEAISAAHFAVQYTIKPPFQFKCEQLRLILQVDGKEVDRRVCSQAELAKNPHGISNSLAGVTRSQGRTSSIEKFKFSEIKTGDDTSLVADARIKDQLAGVGTITLKIYRVHKGVFDPRTPSTRTWGDLLELEILPEKALKGQALSHSTSLDEPEVIPPKGSWQGCKYLDGKDEPFAVFNFQYRSRKALQDLRILERTPAPVSLEDRPIEELTGEEARELLRRQKERQASKVSAVKPELRAQRDVKREYQEDEEYTALLASARPNKVARTIDVGEVIDLSED